MDIKIIFLLINLLIISCNSEQIKKEDSNLLLYSSAIYDYNRNNFKSALKKFDSIIKIDSTNPDVYYKKANCLGFLKEFEQSNQFYLKAIKYGYINSDIYFNIGLNYFLLKDYKQAYKYFLKAYELNPNDKESKMFKDKLEIRLNLKK